MANISIPGASKELASIETPRATSELKAPAPQVEAPAPQVEAPAPQVEAPAPQVEDDVSKQAEEAVQAVIKDYEMPRKPSMQSSVALAVGTNPDAEAEARRVAMRTGVPVETVFAKPDEMKRKAALSDIDFKSYESLYPASALALSDIDMAKIAHDDTENMGYVENILRGVGGRSVNLAGGLLRFVGTANQSLMRFEDQYFPAMIDTSNGIRLRHMTPQEKASATGFDNTVNALESFNLGFTPRTTWEDVKSRPLKEFLPFAIEQGLVSAPDMAMAVFSPGTYAASLTGEMGQNRAKNDLRESATLEDFVNAAPAAIANSLLERFGTRSIVGVGDVVAIKSGKQLAKATGKAALKEGATEAGQNAAQTEAETIGTKKGLNVQDMVESAAQGFVAGAPFGGAVRSTTGGVELAINRYKDKVEQSRTAQKNAQQFDQLNSLAAESKLRSRDPLAFQNFIDQVTKQDGAVQDVYVDPNALAQSGIDIKALAAASPSVAAQIDTAVQTGVDLKIPVSEYTSHLAGTELGQAIVDHLKTDPLGMSRAESKVFEENHQQQLEQDVQKILAQKEEISVIQQSVDKVKGDFLEKLNQVNRFTPDVNEQYATLISNFYKVQSARVGMTPEEMSVKYPLGIQSILNEGTNSGKALDQTGLNGDSFFDPKALEEARNQASDSRNKLIYMHPQDFLDLAMSGSDKTKEERVKGLVDKGTKFDEVPFIGFTHDGEGTAAVTGHEGRHRARELLARGVTEMPVVLSHRYDPNGQALKWGDLSDFNDQYPNKLFAQYGDDTASQGNKGKSIPFPVLDPRNLDQEEPSAKRGSFNIENRTITLLENADLTTFLHESGHFFLEIMNQLALDPNAPVEIKQDMQTLLDWWGVKDIQEWNSHDLQWQRDKHEMFARGFEAYLLEGKSPSIEMQGVFQRFRAWMLNVYRHIVNLDVELTDEVRGVFDRMIASTEEIKEMENARGYEPMFADAATAGMSQDEWNRYQEQGIEATQNAAHELESRSIRDMKWLSNAKSRIIKDLQREAAGRRREIRDQVTKEVMAEPVNQARQFITKGELTLDEKANKETKRLALEVGLGSTKLSLPALKEMYGEKENAPWRYFSTGKSGEVGTEGLHPDLVAEMFGFSSGDELVRALLSAEKPKEKIAGLTDQRMLERYGDLTDPQAIERAADEAIHNEARTRFVATEANALQKMVGGRKIVAEAARQFAANMIAKLKVREVQPSRYTSAEAREARAAAKAMKESNVYEAAVHKRNQLVHNFAAKEAFTALSDIEKAIQYFKRFDRDGIRKNIDAAYLDQIDAMLERFDLRKGQSLKTIDKRKSLVDWVKAQEDLGIEPDIDPKLMNEALKMSYKDMTVEDIRGLRDAIKQIEHLGKLKNRLLTAQDNRDFRATVDGMAASINENANGRVVDNRTRANKLGAAIRLFKGFVAQHRKIASLAKELDGFKDGGPVWDNLIRSMNVAGDHEATMREKATKELAKIVQPILKLGKMGGKGLYFESVKMSLNREERLGIVLNMGNAGNMQRLLDGEGWTRQQVQPILDSLTKEEMDYVQKVWEFFETFRPQIGAKEKRVFGKQPNWIEPQKLETKHGEYAGGYYPIKYDSRRNKESEKFDDAELAKQQMRGAYVSATTRRSFTKERAEQVVGRPLLYSMDGLFNGVNEIIHDLAWHEWLIDANRLMRDKALDGAIRTGYGAEVVKQFKSAIEDIAGGEMPTGTSFEKGVSELRAGAVVAGLGFNIVNSAINVTGIANSIVRVGPKWVAMGVAKWTAHPIELTAEVHDKSEFMRHRSVTMMRELNEIQSLIRGKTRARQVVDRLMFMPMTVTQIAVDVPTWYGAYQKALTEGNEENKSIALADQAVIDAQGGGQVKDLAAVQRGSPIMKLFTTFYGFFGTAYNLGVERTKATNFKDPASVLKLGGEYLMLYTVPAVMGTLIKNALVGESDDWDLDKLAPQLANDQISYLMGLMVGLREVTGAAQTVAGVNPYTSSYGGPSGLRFFQEIYNLSTQIHQGEADEALTKTAINTLGIVFKLPAAQINRTLFGTIALVEGKTENPAAIVAGPPRKN